MADYHWPPADKRSLIGKRISRLDGPWKSQPARHAPRQNGFFAVRACEGCEH